MLQRNLPNAQMPPYSRYVMTFVTNSVSVQEPVRTASAPEVTATENYKCMPSRITKLPSDQTATNGIDGFKRSGKRKEKFSAWNGTLLTEILLTKG
jgi:pyruvate dehydrogenase complex dehydrogenase (E1) component